MFKNAFSKRMAALMACALLLCSFAAFAEVSGEHMFPESSDGSAHILSPSESSDAGGSAESRESKTPGADGSDAEAAGAGETAGAAESDGEGGAPALPNHECSYAAEPSVLILTEKGEAVSVAVSETRFANYHICPDSKFEVYYYCTFKGCTDYVAADYTKDYCEPHSFDSNDSCSVCGVRRGAIDGSGILPDAGEGSREVSLKNDCIHGMTYDPDGKVVWEEAIPEDGRYPRYEQLPDAADGHYRIVPYAGTQYCAQCILENASQPGSVSMTEVRYIAEAHSFQNGRCAGCGCAEADAILP